MNDPDRFSSIPGLKPVRTDMTVQSENILRLITQLVNAWNSHEVDLVVEFYASDYQGRDVGQPKLEIGQAGVRERLKRYFRAFPDLTVKPQDIIVEGDRVALVWTAQGTHLGSLMNIPPTGRIVEVSGMSVLSLENGKVKEALYIWDMAGLLRSIGLLPELQ
jgi:steroid delta-isomerase-like uncharacterized protein